MFNAAASNLRRRFSAIRYIHLAVGRPDFATFGIVYKMTSDAYSRKHPKSRGFLFDLELLARGGDNAHHSSDPAMGGGSRGAISPFTIVCAQEKCGI